jgi:hypothetical protein
MEIKLEQKKTSPKMLCQFKPNFAGIFLRWTSFYFISDTGPNSIKDG